MSRPWEFDETIPPVFERVGPDLFQMNGLELVLASYRQDENGRFVVSDKLGREYVYSDTNGIYKLTPIPDYGAYFIMDRPLMFVRPKSTGIITGFN